MCRRSVLLLLFAFLSSCLSGCWSRVEVNDIAIVTATGLDAAENGRIRLSLLIAVPRLIGTGSAQGTSESELEATAAWVVSEEGMNIMDTFRRLQQKLPREIFFAHSRVLIVGKALAQREIGPYLDFFSRYRQSQIRSYIAVSSTTASDILNFKSKFEKLPSEVLEEEIELGFTTKVRIVDFINSLTSEGDEPFAPVVEIAKSEPGRPDSANLKVSGLAVFRGSRMVGTLTDKESRGVMWVRNTIKEGVITVDAAKAERKGTVSAELEHVRVRRQLSFDGGSVAMKLDISVTENIYENNSDLNLMDLKDLSTVQKLMEQAIRERIRHSVRKVQHQFKSDIFGYGQSIYRTYPQTWKRRYREQWDDRFPSVRTIVEVHIEVLRTGLTNQTISQG